MFMGLVMLRLRRLKQQPQSQDPKHHILPASRPVLHEQRLISQEIFSICSHHFRCKFTFMCKGRKWLWLPLHLGIRFRIQGF